MKLLLIIVFIAVSFYIAPLLFLWSINTLLEHAQGVAIYVPHNIWTYLASYLLVCQFSGAAASYRSK